MRTNFILAAVLALSACVPAAPVETYQWGKFYQLDIHRLEQANSDYTLAQVALNEVLPHLSTKRGADGQPSQTEEAIGLDNRAHEAWLALRAAYDNKDAVQFEYQAGVLRRLSQQITTFAAGVHHHG